MTTHGKPCQDSKELNHGSRRVQRRHPSFAVACIMIQLLLFLFIEQEECYAFALVSPERKRMLRLPTREPTEYCGRHRPAVYSSKPFNNEREVSTKLSPSYNTDYKNRKKEWIDRSVKYYTTLRRICHNDVAILQSPQEEIITREAILMHAALRKIKEKKFHHAEIIYRRSITRSVQDLSLIGGHCDYTKLAVSTLLLGLLKQRVGDVKGTRSAFLTFFRILITTTDDTTVFKCSCSAKVLQAFGLFEMKCGSAQKSLFLLEKAVSMDETLAPVLNWKQFRDAAMSKKRSE